MRELLRRAFSDIASALRKRSVWWALASEDIDIDDLLRRSPVPADPELMRDVVEGRVILVTGAAGSIGSALSRTIAALKPAKLVLMDFNEHGLYQIGRELAKDAAFPVVRVLGSVDRRCSGDADHVRA